MATTIRSGIFETNSSSSHVFVMSKKDAEKNCTVTRDEVNKTIFITPEEISNDDVMLVDPISKLIYLVSSLVKTQYDDDTSIVDSILEVNHHPSFIRLAGIFKKETGLNLKIKVPKDTTNIWSFIDHQSHGDTDQFLMDKDDEQLNMFLFSTDNFIALTMDG